MNRKGFTLTELILTIALLAVLGVVIVSNMSGLLEKNKEENYNNFVTTIENAACTFIDLKVASNYVDLNECKSASGCEVSISYLLQEGLLTEKQIVSPKTNESIGYKSVKITYPSKKKTCTFVE